MKEEGQSVVQIDEHRLDRECVRLPGDFLKWAHLAAESKKDVAELENRLEVVYADLSKEIRLKPEDFQLEKITEAAIKETIRAHPRYQKVTQKLIDCQHHANMAQAVVSALDQKKRALTNLVELHGMGYFANPRVSEEGRQAVNKMTMKRMRRES